MCGSRIQVTVSYKDIDRTAKPNPLTKPVTLTVANNVRHPQSQKQGLALSAKVRATITVEGVGTGEIKPSSRDLEAKIEA
jgi:hypothetical protein